MGIRAERKQRRELAEAAKKTVLPGGKTLFPCGFVHDFCIQCEHNRSGIFDPKKQDDVYVSVCRKGYRQNLYYVKAYSLKGAPLIASTFPVIAVPQTKGEKRQQRCRAGGCDVLEGCPQMVVMLMQGDIDRIYDF